MLDANKIPAIIEEIIRILTENPDALQLPVRNDESLWCRLAHFYYGVSSLSKRINVCIHVYFLLIYN